MDELLADLQDQDPDRRASVVRKIAGLTPRWSEEPPRKPKRLTGKVHAAVLELLDDPVHYVRRNAFEALAGTPVDAAEVDKLVQILNWGLAPVRQRCIERLRALPEADQLAVAERLLGDEDKRRRQAGFETLRDMVETGRLPEAARRLTSQLEKTLDLSGVEAAHVEAILADTTSVPTTRDSLGLVDVGQLPTWDGPRRIGVDLVTNATVACIDSFAALLLEHLDDEVVTGDGDRRRLADAPIRGPLWRNNSLEDNFGRLPLPEIWQAWASERRPALRDTDGLELVRAYLSVAKGPAWASEHARRLADADSRNSAVEVFNTLMSWCVHWQRPTGALTLALDTFEDVLSGFTDADLTDMRASDYRNAWREPPKPYKPIVDRATELLKWYRELRRLLPEQITDEHRRRGYALLRWYELESSGYSSMSLSLDDFVDAHRAGLFGDRATAELTDLLIGRPNSEDREYNGFIEQTSTPKPPEQLAGFPELQAAAERSRARIVEVETQRGQLPTAASRLTMSLYCSGGLDTLARAMRALGKTKFTSGYGLDWELERQDSLSNLVVRSMPGSDDSHEAFAAWVADEKVEQVRLLELAVYAPQWAGHVGSVLEWPGLESAVWWMHAHMPDDRANLGSIEELWNTRIGELTPLRAADRAEGAVDVAWFRSALAELGAERWRSLSTAAKYASDSGGHRRPQRFASAMLGELTEDELIARIERTRHQDSVRALGLVPLPDDADQMREAVRARYLRMQEFKRETRLFGSRRQHSEGRAVAIGMQNLARTAGLEDPVRLQWAMEMEAAEDLARGPLTYEKDQVRFELRVDDDGQPELTTTKNGKPLGSVPAKLRKDPGVMALTERAEELRAQASRVKGALEQAMCRGDVFEGKELQGLLRNPVLSPSLARLVFVGDHLIGYPVEAGAALADHAGKLEPVGEDERLRIAHPLDLFERGDWPSWQRDCFERERVQPFEQVFRKLYPLTQTERDDKWFSARYAGHVVEPRQAIALLRKRGWVLRPHEGVSKTYHHEGLTARLAFDRSFHTPAEVESLTLETTKFTNKGEWNKLDVTSIPARVFSETMRDLDLVVSVAGAGGAAG